MVVQIKDRFFMVDLMSVGLNLIGFIALIASWQDGLLAVIIALLIFLLDEVKHPNPVIMEVKEEDIEKNDDNDLDAA